MHCFYLNENHFKTIGAYTYFNTYVIMKVVKYVQYSDNNTIRKLKDRIKRIRRRFLFLDL